MDQLRRPQRGDPLKIPAFVYSEMLDTVEFVRGLRRSESASMVRLARDRGLVKVKNESGSDVARFGILGVDGIIAAINPTDNLAAWKNEPVLSGNTPDTDDHYGKFVVLVEPLADDAIGWGLASGVVPAQVAYAYSDSPYADIGDGDADKLADGEGGAAQVLYKESGTGTKWSIVRLGTPWYPTLKGTFDSDVTASGDTTVSVGSTSRNITANVPVGPGSGKKWASGTVVFCAWDAGVWNVVSITACPVAAS